MLSACLLLALLPLAPPTLVAPPGDASAWDFARDAARIAREFERLELLPETTADHGKTLDWKFKLREGGFADLFCRRAIDTPFSRLRMVVRNRGAAMTLAVKLAEASDAEWTAQRVPLAAGGDWQTVEFPLSEFQVASWSKDRDGTLSFPTHALAVIAFDVHPGPDYDLQIAEVSVVPPIPAKARVTVTGLPARIAAGDTVRATIGLTLDGELPQEVRNDVPVLGVALAGSNALHVPIAWDRRPDTWKPGEAVTGKIDTTLSNWVSGGAGTWRLLAAGIDCGKENVLGSVTVSARQPGPLTSAVKPYHGAPTLFINGKPVPAVAYAAYGPTAPVFRDFAKAGVKLYTICGTPTSHGYGLARDSAIGPGKWDFGQLDERIRMVLDACPDGYVFPRLYCSAPDWWLDQHPEAVVTYDPGDGHPKPFVQDGRRVPSWASEPWRAFVAEGLQQLVAHIAKQPFADRVIGYHLASGTTEEWMMWGANDDCWTDYSPAAEASWRAWLTRRYSNDAGLQAAWHRPDAKLATATAPMRAERARSAAGTLRSPATDMPSIDYSMFCSDLAAETIDRLCGETKRITGGHLITGVFYGYLLQLFGQRQQNGAHLAFNRVVRSTNVDFLCSPTSYAFRHLGDGTSHFMAPLDSVLAHGKLWFDENDIRTSLAPGAVGEWGRPPDVAGDLLQQDRELANVLTHGTGQWWFDVGANRYDDAKLMGHLAELCHVAQQAFEADRSPVDQVALVVDGRGVSRVNVGDMLLQQLMLEPVVQLARIGAPVGHYELNDVDQLQRHKVILFSPLYDPSPAALAAIEKLKGDGRVLIFTHAPAPYHNGVWEPDRMAAICGLKLRIEDKATVARVKYAAGQPDVSGLGEGYGWNAAIRPTVVGDDPQATVLGTLPDGSPGLLMRHYPTWTAIWSAAPNLPTALVARLAENEHVHRYVTTPDVVWASRELLALSVNEAGKRTVRLPQPSNVVELSSGQTVCDGGTTFEVDMATASTRLWRVLPK